MANLYLSFLCSFISKMSVEQVNMYTKLKIEGEGLGGRGGGMEIETWELYNDTYRIVFRIAIYKKMCVGLIPVQLQ